MADDDVDNLSIKELASGAMRLSWKTIESLPCVDRVTYSVFRSTDEKFVPSDANRIAHDLTVGYFVTKDPYSETFYYHVRPVFTPTPCKPAVINTPNQAYRTLFRGTHTVHLFSNDSTEFTFSIATSWIPGSTGRGEFRYKFDGTPVGTGDGGSAYALKMRSCVFFLDVYDESGFKLMETAIPAINTVNDKARPEGISANSSQPMSFSDYRHYAAASDSSSWDVEWQCPQN